MAPGFDCAGTVLEAESSVAGWLSDVPWPFLPLFIVWDSTPIGALTHGPNLHGNDPLPKHVSTVYYLLGSPSGLWCIQDYYSHMGGSSDAKPWTSGDDCIWEYR